MRRIIQLLSILVLLIVSAGCGTQAVTPTSAPTATTAPAAAPTGAAATQAPTGAITPTSAAAATGATTPSQSTSTGQTLTVYAAASLTESFQDIASAFSSENGGAKVEFSFGASNQLRAQIEQGAPVDVFASANEKEMTTLVTDTLVLGAPQIFAKNRLVVIVPKANPGKIEKLQDLARPGVKLVVAAPNVPVGGYALQVLDEMNADPSYGAGFKDKVVANIVSQETDVKQVVAKVQLGEGDAGFVYLTDVTSKVSPDVTVLDIPDKLNMIAKYPIGAIMNGKNRDLAQAFVSFVMSPEGQAILKKYNFVPAK